MALVTKENEEMRKKLRRLLKEKGQFNNLFEELMKKLTKGKRIMADIVEQSRQEFQKRFESHSILLRNYMIKMCYIFLKSYFYSCMANTPFSEVKIFIDITHKSLNSCAHFNSCVPYTVSLSKMLTNHDSFMVLKA